MPLLLRKKFALSSKLRYPLALVFIVSPALALGIAGSIAIVGLEKRPHQRHQAARTAVTETHAKIRAFVESLIPEMIPTRDPTAEEAAAEAERLAAEEAEQAALLREGKTAPEVKKIQIGVKSIPISSILTLQRATVLHDSSGILDGVVNFHGTTPVSSFFRDETKRSDLGPFEETAIIHVAKETVARATTRAQMRRIVSIAVDRSSDYGTDISVMLELGDHGQTTLLGRWWSVWVIQRQQLSERVQDMLPQAPDGESISLGLYPPDSPFSKEGSSSMRFGFDDELLPGYSVIARVDDSLQPIGGEDWRSRFYIVFLAVTVPLLAGILWFIEVVVRRELEDAKHKVDFVANVSHELKTPLTSIRMFIEMLLSGRSASEEETHESLQIILRESERLGRLIDRLLDFNRLDRKTKVFEMLPLNFPKILRETVKVYRAEAVGADERSITLAIEPGLPPVDGDRDALREVILNLLTNADKYSPRDRPINVHLGLDGRTVILQIIDQGQGIPLRYHQRIFEKFYRVNDELARQIEGTGLGLSISQQIAKAHGGVIEVESIVGQGSCFTLRLPISIEALPEYDDSDD